MHFSGIALLLRIRGCRNIRQCVLATQSYYWRSRLYNCSTDLEERSWTMRRNCVNHASGRVWRGGNLSKKVHKLSSMTVVSWSDHEEMFLWTACDCECAFMLILERSSRSKARSFDWLASRFIIEIFGFKVLSGVKYLNCARESCTDGGCKDVRWSVVFTHFLPQQCCILKGLKGSLFSRYAFFSRRTLSISFALLRWIVRRKCHHFA